MSELVEVLNAIRERFLSFLMRRVGSRDAAEEILQASFLKIVARRAAPLDQERVEAWFYRILRNAVVDHYRRRGAETRSLEALRRSSGPEGAFDAELEDAVCACVGDVLPGLKPAYEAIIRRVDLEQNPLSEASAEMGLSANNAGVRLHRARAALRKLLGEVCGACTEHGCLSCACRPRKGPRAGTGGRGVGKSGGAVRKDRVVRLRD